jgi:hypothetical protein
MIYYPQENALLLSGGRNDKIQMIYSDIYFLALDTLTWLKVENINGAGALALADHMFLQFRESDFIVFGGIDTTY